MKHLLVFLILISVIGKASAQKPRKWTHLKGPNMGSAQHTLMFDESGNIISVGTFGYYLSSDNGNSWVDHQVVPSKNWICSVSSYYGSGGGSPGLLISPTGEYYFSFWDCDYTDSTLIGVYRSTDKGDTWEHVMKSYQAIQLALGAGNSILVFAIPFGTNKFKLFQTIDKGNSWTEIFEPPNFNFIMVGSNDNYLYVLYQSYPQRISYSDHNMTSYTSGLYTGYLYGELQLNNNLFIAIDNYKVYTSDGENKWDSVGSFVGIINLTKGNGNSVYTKVYSQTYGTLSIYGSADTGRDWNIVTGLPITYYNYSFNDENPDKLLFENDTSVYLSIDRGKSWNEIGMPFDSIERVLVTDEGRIIAEPADHIPNSYSSLYPKDTRISSDRGDTWYKSQPSGAEIQGIGRGLSGGIIAVAPESSNSSINYVWLYDTSLPTQWHKRSIVHNVTAHPLITSDGTKSIYIAGDYYYFGNPTIYRSDDNGFTWVDIEAPTTPNEIYSLEASPDGTLYFGTYTVMYRSDDRGATWTKIIPVNDIVKLTAIKTFGTTGVLLGTEGDGLLISNDKGNTWSRLDGNNFDTVTCIGINSNGEIAAGTNRGLWTSDSSRQHWTKVTLGNDANLYIGSLDVASDDDFYVGTYGSSVWKGTTHYNSVKYTKDEYSVMKLSPNPTTGKITIDLNLPHEEYIRLELYDILGRKITVLADGTYAGENQIYFNTANLPNGIYTIMLTGVQQNQSHKLVLAR